MATSPRVNGKKKELQVPDYSNTWKWSREAASTLLPHHPSGPQVLREAGSFVFLWHTVKL